MSDESISLGSMSNILSTYALNPHKSGAASKVKRFAKAGSMSEVLSKLCEEVRDGKADLATLHKLRQSVTLLKLKDERKVNGSIFHKASKVSDFFRSLVIPDYKKSKVAEITSASNELNNLATALDKEIEARKNEKSGKG